MGYGQGAAQNFKINPQYIGSPQQQVAPQEVQPSSVMGAIDPNDPLAIRDKLTSDYYNNYGQLKSFAASMAKQGIDVFEADYSQPGGGAPFKTAMRLQAGLMYASNALKGEYEAEKQMRPMEVQGQVQMKQGVDRNGMYASDASNYYSTDATPMVKEANARLNTPTFTNNDQNNFNQAYLDETIGKLDQLVQQGMMSPEQAQQQKNMLMENVKQTSYQQLIPRATKPGKNYDSQIGLLKKYTNLSQGVWNDGTYRPEERKGQLFLVNSEGQGDVLGRYEASTDKNGAPVLKDKVVKNWLKDPDTGEVFIEFTDPTIPMERVSNQRGDAITRTFVSNNSKYGSVDKIMEAATELGLTDDVGSAINSALMPEDSDARKKTVRESAGPVKEKLKQAKVNIKKELSGLKSTLFGNDKKVYPLPNGTKLEIGRHQGEQSFYINNPEEIGLSGDVENLTMDEVYDYLSQAGFFQRYFEQPQQSAAPQEAQPVDRAAQIKAKYGIK